MNGIVDHPLFNKDHGDNSLIEEVRQQIEIEVKYEGYFNRQRRQIERFNKMEHQVIPERFDYSKLNSLSTEAREKLTQIRPRSIGQASRIAGVSPADIAVLLISLRKR